MKRAQLIRITARASSLPSMWETITAMVAYRAWYGPKLFYKSVVFKNVYFNVTCTIQKERDTSVMYA